MNRKEFGQLLLSLRQDLGWTQQQLAELADTDVSVVSLIERGVKKHFEPELLFHLANVLQLTSLERREFLIAASGLDMVKMARQPSVGLATNTNNVQKILKDLIAMTGQIQLPAFLIDVYGDVIAANYMILTFFQVPQAVMETAGVIPGGYNIIRINFSREMVSRTQVMDHWDEYAVTSIRTFRENSLRYRAKPYFQYLMKVFRDPIQYPFFNRYWNLVSSSEEDKELDADYFAYRHREFGELKYIASPTISVTNFGELFLYYYAPCDEHTRQVFDALRNQAGIGALQFAPWPEKKMP